MRCEEIMKRRVECVRPGDSCASAAAKMRDQNVGFLPVCDPANRVIGTVTDRDLALRILADNRQASTRVEDVMTHEIVQCRPSDDIRQAEQLMARNHKSRILVVDNSGTLVGVISLSDLARTEERDQFIKTYQEITEREVHA
ncbi:MAG: CBS domain-containing protein [Deltaproteobacteria bacterium]|nr:CBS domain-containing protein [Deltaproteobacteria bacterium]